MPSTMTTDQRPSPTIGGAVTRLGELADSRRAELDRACRIPDDIALDVARAGLFRQLVSPELGGSGARPLDWFRTGVELARHEPSLGWVVTQGAAELGWIGAGADDRWARDVLADPLAASASTRAGLGTLVVDGGTSRVSGTWAFNTGCQSATWIGGLTLVEGATDDDGLPVTRWAWVPAARAEVLEDWNADGLRATGSHSTVIPEQEIPTTWTFSPEEPTSNDRGPYRVLVGNGSWPIATAVAATQLGNARRTLDEAVAVVLAKAPPPLFKPLARNAAVQRTITEAEGLWAAANASVERELDAMWDEARAFGELRRTTRVALQRANLAANGLAVRVVDLATELAGATAIARDHVLSRCRRDAHALAAHITVGGAAAELNARVALGQPESHILV
jgi:alkylation response protein AidB-like acyl-CoA dehydrogenase